jgi:hypothetical protein
LLDNYKRFALDNDIFSSIIYIWYEGVRLRPRLVKLDSRRPRLPSGGAGPSGGTMAKKAKKAAAKKKTAAKKKK